MKLLSPAKLIGSALITAVLSATPAFADFTANNWAGLNSSASNSSTDVSIDGNWSLTHAPISGERAVFAYTQSAAGTAGTIDIPSTATFAPDALTFSINASNPASATLTVNKDLTLSDITLLSSITSGTPLPATGRILFATTNAVTINLTGSSPLDATGGSFAMLNTGAGGDTARTIFNLSNASITIPQLSQTINANNDTHGGFAGGAQVENTSDTINSQVNFTAHGGAINIASAGNRTNGNLAIGFSQLNIRADQTWTSSDTGFIHLNYRLAPPTGTITERPTMIGSLNDDGTLGSTRLDNLGQLHIFLDGAGGSSSTAATAMRIGGGTYGSLRFSQGSHRGDDLTLADDVEFASTGVQAGSYVAGAGTPATVTPYGVTLAVSGQSGGTISITLSGHTLKVDQGVQLTDSTGVWTNYSATTNQINASSSILTIGGDLNIHSVNESATAATSNANTPSTANGNARSIGIVGNAATTVNLGGSITADTCSLTGAALSGSTVNLNGGPTQKTFEVADASTKNAVVASGLAVGTNQQSITGGFSYGTLNVGTAAATSNIKLVNANLNDNAVIAASGAASNAGEKLIAGTLAIAANSTLDVSALNVLVGNTLNVDPLGTLDLDSGITQTNGTPVVNSLDSVYFLGLGNQVDQWNALASHVIDSSNPGFTFIAAQDATGSITGLADSTYWQAVSATPTPEPASLSLLALGAAALLTRRKSRHC